MNNLLPCPFCGGEAVAFKDNYDKCGVYCSCCNMILGVALECGTELKDGWRAEFETPEEAISAWNRRAQPSEKPLTLDELRGMDGEPVYVIRVSGAKIKMWVIACPNEYGLTQDRNAESQLMAWSTYGRVWLAFRSKPKEEV